VIVRLRAGGSRQTVYGEPMPLIFVHGVNTRYKPNPVPQDIQSRDGLFRQYALPDVVADPAGAAILNPYWGDYGATFAWNNASLPKEKYEPFGGGGSVFEQILPESASDIHAPAANQVLVTLARKSLPRAIDVLWAAGAYTDSGETVADEMAASARDATEYARANPTPPWLAHVRNDEEFVDSLLNAIPPRTAGGPQSFGGRGLWNHFTTAVTNIGNSAAAFVINPVARAVRPYLHHGVSVFIGDVFVYLSTREQPKNGPIVAEIKTNFERAAAAKTAKDNLLIVVAHSMGGNISYDVLTSFAPHVDVDLFVTVGSQVGLFEELKLFKLREAAIKAPKKMRRPPNVKRWINVIDPSDPLAYAVSGIFDDTIDTSFDSDAPVWSAHTSYFVRPLFHERLRARILGQ
jgi:hypothetical protein